MTAASRSARILEDPIGTRLILSVAWPLIISHQLMMFATLIAMFWIGRLEGPDGLTVYAIVSPVAISLWWLLQSVPDGASSIVARGVGSRDGEGLHTIGSALVLCLTLAAVVVAPAVLASPWLAEVLAGHIGLAGLTRSYLVMCLIAMVPPLVLSEILLDAVSATGDTRFGLLRVITNLGLMALLVPLMISLLGLPGVALAEGCSAVLLAALLARVLHRSSEAFGLGRRDRRRSPFDLRLWRRLLAIGLPPQLARIVMFAVLAVATRVISRDGAVTAAAYGVAIQVLFVVNSTTMAIARSAAILIGQNLGAGAPARARQAFRASAIVLAALTLPLALLLPLARPAIYLIAGPEVIGPAMDLLDVLRWTLPAIAGFQLFTATFTAHGRTHVAGALMLAAETVNLAIVLLWPGPATEAVVGGYLVAAAIRFVALLIWDLIVLREPPTESAPSG